MSAFLLTFYLINFQLRWLLVHDVFNELSILTYADTYDAQISQSNAFNYRKITRYTIATF